MRTRTQFDRGNIMAPALVYGQPRARWVLTATVLASAMVFIDGTVTNIALPRIGANLHSGLHALTWVVNAYTLTLAALVLLGGSLGDRLGRRRVFVIGVAWFTMASVLCAAAPTVETLIAARGLQGVGGALLTPGSLAILQASFRPEDRPHAVAAWSGRSGIGGAVAPLVGGALLTLGSWRWIFLVNLPFAAVVLLAARQIPETRAPAATGPFDVAGTVLAALALGGITVGLSTWSRRDASLDAVIVPLVAGAGLLLLFVARERHAPVPLVPPQLFRSRLFTTTNAVTFLVYAAFAGAYLWLVLALQVVTGLTPFTAGTALLPVTVLLLLLSTRAGALGKRTGPRLPLMLGPALCAAGVAAMTRIDQQSSYLPDVLPAVLLLGLGLSVTVAPLTGTVLAAAPEQRVGIASGVNNAVARAAGLLAVAALPALAGAGDSLTHPAMLLAPYRRAMWISAGLLVAAALLAAVALRTPRKLAGERPEDRAAPPVSARARPFCDLQAPPLLPGPTPTPDPEAARPRPASRSGLRQPPDRRTGR